MNWEAIGSVAEVVGAIGVIVSLLYLAIQVRQGNKNHVVDSHQQIARDWGASCAVVMRDENVSAFIKGLSEYEDLTAEERVKFDMCVGIFINVVEVTIYHAEAGRLDEVLEMLNNYLGPRLFAYPGLEKWWRHGNRAGFSHETQAWVDKQIERNRGGVTFWEHAS